MLQYDDSFVHLKAWHRVGCALIAASIAGNFLLPWPPTDRIRFAIGFSGTTAYSLMAIFGNRVRGARLLSAVAMLVFIATMLQKLIGHGT